MKYELTIRELTPFTKEEIEESERRNRNSMDRYPIGYSDKPYHETRVLNIEVTAEELQKIKRGVLEIM